MSQERNIQPLCLFDLWSTRRKLHNCPLSSFFCVIFVFFLFIANVLCKSQLSVPEVPKASAFGWCLLHLMLLTQFYSLWWYNPVPWYSLFFLALFIHAHLKLMFQLFGSLKQTEDVKFAKEQGIGHLPWQKSTWRLWRLENSKYLLSFHHFWDCGFSVWGCGSSWRGLFNSLTILLFIALISWWIYSASLDHLCCFYF